jgi:protocatechuate 3,4-dioxygenase beta subunit
MASWLSRNVAKMRPLSIACFLLLVSWQADAQAPQPIGTPKTQNNEKCGVAGTVVRLDTGEPLKKATVILRSHDNGEQSMFVPTDAQGHFQFDKVEPGNYSLEALHNGFVRMGYGQKKYGDPGAHLSLAAGQKMTDLVFKLPRTSSISGRVMDEDGQPLPRVSLRVYQRAGRNSKHQLHAVAGALTNDLGDYRVFDLAPGRYYVRANYQEPREVMGIQPSSSKSPKESYPPTFYPNAADPAKAVGIIVNAGDQIPSVDFLLEPVPVVNIRGKVFNTIASGTDSNFFVTLMQRGEVGNDFAPVSGQVWNKEGRFEFRDVFPGSYIIGVSWIVNQERYSARREVEVGNADVEGINVTVMRGVDVAGRVAWEQKPPGEAQGVHVALQVSDPGPFSWNSGASEAKPDGAFLIKNVPQGVYRPHVFTGGLDCFLKSARYGDADVTDGGLSPQAGTDAALELKLSCRAARIEGVALTGDSLPAAGVYVVAIPDAPHRDHDWEYRAETTDQNGRFLLRGIVPGDYRLFSWNCGDDFDWYDREQLKPYESKGVRVSVEEGDRKTIQLEVLETENASQARQ